MGYFWYHFGIVLQLGAVVLLVFSIRVYNTLVAQASFLHHHCSTFSMVPVFYGNYHCSSSKSSCSERYRRHNFLFSGTVASFRIHDLSFSGKFPCLRASPMHTENRHYKDNFLCTPNLHGPMHTENDSLTSILAGRF